MNFVLPNLESANRKKEQAKFRRQIILCGVGVLAFAVVSVLIVLSIQFTIYGDYREMTADERDVIVTWEDVKRVRGYELGEETRRGETFVARDIDGGIALEYHFWHDPDEEHKLIFPSNYWTRVFLYKTSEEAVAAFPLRMKEFEEMLTLHPDVEAIKFEDRRMRFGSMGELEQINKSVDAYEITYNVTAYNAVLFNREIYLQACDMRYFEEQDFAWMLKSKKEALKNLPR